MAAAGGDQKYTCNTANETLEWINAIIDFIKPFKFLLDAHVVHFFKDSLWEAVDNEWMNCLRKEPVENLVLIPSGVVQNHWPNSLKKFILTLRHLSFTREQADLQKEFPGLDTSDLNKVLAQGMNPKKKHEVKVLGGVVNSIAKRVGSDTIIDVGSGQGYLAQVLSFQHKLSVYAIDSCSHHGKVTDDRSERIKKHYAAKIRKSSDDRELRMPKTVTCQVSAANTLKDLSNSISNSSLILAGLHACGDLSVTMLRTFLECEEVKAVISIGCCYNSLSEEYTQESDIQCGFPLSKGVKTRDFKLGKNARDLACQSAERWKSLGKATAQNNFDLHAFRSTFQMVLLKYYPEKLIISSPIIGRQGKTLRRQQNWKILESSSLNVQKPEEYSGPAKENESDKFVGLVKFCESALSRLDLPQLLDDDIFAVWKETKPFVDFIGPYWSLRTALGPVLETIILLDRLLFIQERGDSLKVEMVPIFDPILSPRNMALIAQKV